MTAKERRDWLAQLERLDYWQADVVWILINDLAEPDAETSADRRVYEALSEGQRAYIRELLGTKQPQRVTAGGTGAGLDPAIWGDIFEM